jgi:hypothetical protein
MLVSAKISNTDYYVGSIEIGEDDLSLLRDDVESQYLRNLAAFGIIHYGNQSLMFHKSNRVLPPIDIVAIKRRGFISVLRHMFGNFSLSNVVIDGQVYHDSEEIYWRIVRPNEPTDVGPAHRDVEFHQRDGMHAGRQTIKCWIPLWCESDCGLAIEAQYGTWQCDQPGKIYLFGPQVLHHGMINTGTTARVSVEMTLVLE